MIIDISTILYYLIPIIIFFLINKSIFNNISSINDKELFILIGTFCTSSLYFIILDESIKITL